METKNNIIVNIKKYLIPNQYSDSCSAVASYDCFDKGELDQLVAQLHCHVDDGVYLSGTDIHDLCLKMTHQPFTVSGVLSLKTKEWAFFSINIENYLEVAQ